MPLNKSHLVELVRKRIGVRKHEARVIVDSVFSEVMRAIARGEKVELRGIGTFRARLSPARWARDFRGRKAVRVGAVKRVSFRVSRKLRNTLAGAARREGRGTD